MSENITILSVPDVTVEIAIPNGVYALLAGFFFLIMAMVFHRGYLAYFFNVANMGVMFAVILEPQFQNTALQWLGVFMMVISAVSMFLKKNKGMVG